MEKELVIAVGDCVKAQSELYACQQPRIQRLKPILRPREIKHSTSRQYK